MLKSIEYEELTISEQEAFSPKSSVDNALKISYKNRTSTSTDSVDFEWNFINKIIMVETNQNRKCGASSNILALKSRHSFTTKLFENMHRRKIGMTLLDKRKE